MKTDGAVIWFTASNKGGIFVKNIVEAPRKSKTPIIMQRIGGYFALFLSVGVIGQGAYDVCKRCNNSYRSLASQDPPSFYHPRLRVPSGQDVSYLPEEDYNEQREQEQQQFHNRDNRNLLPEYRNLCETITKRVQLDDSEYEYQPPHYHEVYCKKYSLLDNLQRVVKPAKQKCVHPDFHCVQRSKTLILVRRRWDSECWEPFVKQIASGCDCMWPVSVLGDISDHY